MKSPIKSCTILLLGLALLAAATGCKHTANGFGKDVEHVGEKIQDKTH